MRVHVPAAFQNIHDLQPVVDVSGRRSHSFLNGKLRVSGRSSGRAPSVRDKPRALRIAGEAGRRSAVRSRRCRSADSSISTKFRLADAR
jgi:hypothetical protein